MTIEIMTEASETMAVATAATACTANRAKADVVLTTNATGIPAKTGGAVNPAADIRQGWAATTSQTMEANVTGTTIASTAVNATRVTAARDPDTVRKAVERASPEWDTAMSGVTAARAVALKADTARADTGRVVTVKVAGKARLTTARVVPAADMAPKAVTFRVAVTVRAAGKEAGAVPVAGNKAAIAVKADPAAKAVMAEAPADIRNVTIDPVRDTANADACPSTIAANTTKARTVVGGIALPTQSPRGLATKTPSAGVAWTHSARIEAAARKVIAVPTNV